MGGLLRSPPRMACQGACCWCLLFVLPAAAQVAPACQLGPYRLDGATVTQLSCPALGSVSTAVSVAFTLSKPQAPASWETAVRFSLQGGYLSFSLTASQDIQVIRYFFATDTKQKIFKPMTGHEAQRFLVTASDTQLRLFRDGQQLGAKQVDVTPGPITDFFVGGFGSSPSFEGCLRDIWAWDEEVDWASADFSTAGECPPETTTPAAGDGASSTQPPATTTAVELGTSAATAADFPPSTMPMETSELPSATGPPTTAMPSSSAAVEDLTSVSTLTWSSGAGTWTSTPWAPLDAISSSSEAAPATMASTIRDSWTSSNVPAAPATPGLSSSSPSSPSVAFTTPTASVPPPAESTTAPALFAADETTSPAPTALATADDTASLATTVAAVVDTSAAPTAQATVEDTTSSASTAAAVVDTTSAAAMADTTSAPTTVARASTVAMADATSSAPTVLARADGTASQVPHADDETTSQVPPAVATANDTTTLPAANYTSTPVAGILSPPELLMLLAAREAAALQGLEGQARIVQEQAGTTAAAFTLPRASVSLEGWQIVLPSALASGPGAAAIALPAVDVLGPGFLAVASISLFQDGGVRRKVAGLEEPILVRMQLTAELDMAAAVKYWDEDTRQWSGKGLSITARGKTWLEFSTTHLTLFALVLEGFLSTLECAQLGLLSWEGLQALRASDWYLGNVALLFWVVLLLLAAALARSCYLDRNERELWGDEFFLVPRQPAQVGGGMAGGALAECGCSVLRDAMDDVCSRWFRWFAEIRDLAEALLGGLGVGELSVKNRCGAFLAQLAAGLVAGNARRQAGASLGLSEDLVSFVLEDEGLGSLLSQAIENGEAADGSLSSQRLQAWLNLHRTVLERVDGHWQDFDGWRKVPRAAWRLFLSVHPSISVFHGCRLLPHSLRTLLLSCDIMGSLMLAAFFFEGSGMATDRRAQRGCDDDEGMDGWRYVGQLLAVSVGSTLLASVPVMVLTSMHSRALVKVDHEGSPDWQWQLRVWQAQDRLIWVLGVIYCSFCATFVMLFLANVAARDLPAWGTSTIIQAVEEQLAIPLVVGLAVPCLTALAVAAVCRVQGTDVRALLKQQRADREDSGGNWRPLMHSI